MILMLDASFPPALPPVSLSCFQSPSRCSNDGASDDIVSSEQSTLHPGTKAVRKG